MKFYYGKRSILIVFLSFISAAYTNFPLQWRLIDVPCQTLPGSPCVNPAEIYYIPLSFTNLLFFFANWLFYVIILHILLYLGAFILRKGKGQQTAQPLSQSISQPAPQPHNWYKYGFWGLLLFVSFVIGLFIVRPQISISFPSFHTNNSASYVKGEVSLFFNDNVPDETIDRIIKEHGLNYNKIDKLSSLSTKLVSVEVPEGKEDYYVEIFSHIPEVKWARLNVLLNVNGN